MSKPITKLIRIALSLTPDKGFKWDKEIEWDVVEKEKTYVRTRTDEYGEVITRRDRKDTPFKINYLETTPNAIRLIFLCLPEEIEEKKTYLIEEAKKCAFRERNIAKKNYEESINMCKHCQ